MPRLEFSKFGLQASKVSANHKAEIMLILPKTVFNIFKVLEVQNY